MSRAQKQDDTPSPLHGSILKRSFSSSSSSSSSFYAFSIRELSEFSNTTRRNSVSSGHETYLISEIASPETCWVFKQFNNERLAATEVAMSYLYRCVLLNQVPKMCVISDYDKASQEMRLIDDPQDEESTVVEYPQKTRGNASRYYSHFLSLRKFLSGTVTEEEISLLNQKGLSSKIVELLKEPLRNKIAFLVDHGLPEAAAASLVFQEDDGHLDNYGMVGDRLVRIDFDMSLYPHVLPERGARRNPDAPTSYQAITTRDLESYPTLTDTNPYYWFTTFRKLAASHGFTQEETKEFSDLQNNSIFIEKSIRTFFKFTLIPRSLIKQVLPDQNSQNYFIRLQENFLKQFLDSKRCVKWLSTQSAQDIETLINEFDHFHQSLSSKEEYLRFNLSEVYSSFYAILRDVNLPCVLQICHNAQVMQNHFKSNSAQYSFFERKSKQLFDGFVQLYKQPLLEKKNLQFFAGTLTDILETMETINNNSSVVFPGFEQTKELLTLCIDQFSSLKFKCRIESEFAMIIILTNEDRRMLIEQIKNWLLSTNDYSKIVQLFEEAHKEYLGEFSAYSRFWTQPKSLEESRPILDKLKTGNFNHEHPYDLINQLLNYLPLHFSKALITYHISRFKDQSLPDQLMQHSMLYAFLQSHPVSELMDSLLIKNFTCALTKALLTEQHLEREWTNVELAPQV